MCMALAARSWLIPGLLDLPGYFGSNCWQSSLSSCRATSTSSQPSCIEPKRLSPSGQATSCRRRLAQAESCCLPCQLSISLDAAFHESCHLNKDKTCKARQNKSNSNASSGSTTHKHHAGLLGLILDFSSSSSVQSIWCICWLLVLLFLGGGVMGGGVMGGGWWWMRERGIAVAKRRKMKGSHAVVHPFCFLALLSSFTCCRLCLLSMIAVFFKGVRPHANHVKR